MENCLLNYFVLNNELKSSCDFNPYLFENSKPVYEVVRIQQGIPLFINDHIERFYNSCKLAGLKTEITPSQLLKRIKVLVESNNLKTGLIKFVYFLHNDNKSYFIAWVSPFYFPSKAQYEQGVEIKTLKGEREKPNAKFANLSIRQIADKVIHNYGVYEALLINSENVITEGSRSNIFFIKKDHSLLFTPHENLILNGITRKKIIEIALNLGIDVFESSFFEYEITCFEAAFITGTSPKVLPVNIIDNFNFNVSNNTLRTLMDKYDKEIINYLKHFSWGV